MNEWQGNRSTLMKHVPVQFCPPQNPHDLIWVRTRAVAVESRRLNIWATARSLLVGYLMARLVYSSVLVYHSRVHRSTCVALEQILFHMSAYLSVSHINCSFPGAPTKSMNGSSIVFWCDAISIQSHVAINGDVYNRNLIYTCTQTYALMRNYYATLWVSNDGCGNALDYSNRRRRILVPTFVDRGVSRGQGVEPPRPLISVF
jgi:hypothetical protein